MTQLGHVQNGVVVPDQPGALPEGAKVRIELIGGDATSVPQKRVGGQWKGRVFIAPDFDELPPDLTEAFGMNQP